MNEKKPTISSSLLEAMEDFATKIDKIRTHDPENVVELACLYSGISGIIECITALRKNDFVSERENEELQKEITKLYKMCRLGH